MNLTRLYARRGVAEALIRRVIAKGVYETYRIVCL